MFSAHTPCGGFPLVLSGSIKVLQRYPNGRELQLYRVKPGESCLLSGSCLLGEAEYDATGIAETDVDLLVVPARSSTRWSPPTKPSARTCSRCSPTACAALMQTVEAIAYQKLDQRLAALLVERAGEGREVQATHQALADDLGSVREIVSRLLRNFEDRGWVELGRERVRLVDPSALAALARG